VGNTERREKHRLSVEKLEAKRPLGRTRCRWDDIKMDRKNRLEGADWTYLVRGRAKRVGIETSRTASTRKSDSGKVGHETEKQIYRLK